MKKVFLLSAFTFVSASVPCQANDFENLVGRFLNTKALPTVASGDQQKIQATIADREALLDRNIESGARSGLLTNPEIKEVRRDLNDIETKEGNYLSDRTLDGQEVHDLLDDLNRLSRKIDVYMANDNKGGFAANAPSRPLNSGDWNQWMKKTSGTGAPSDVPSNQLGVQALIDARQTQVDSAISQALTDRKITAVEAGKYRVRLNEIAQKESTAQADGKVSIEERDRLLNELNEVNSNLRQRMALRNAGFVSAPSASTYGSNLPTRILEARQSGKITPDQQRDMMTKYRAIAQMEVDLRQSGKNFNFEEQKTIMDRFDRLTDDLNQATRDHH